MSGLMRNEAVAVGTTAVQIAPARDRKLIFLKNTSSGAAASAIITVTFSNVQVAVANEGFVLDPRGIISDSDGGDYKCWDGAISAISDTAAAQLSVVERM